MELRSSFTAHSDLMSVTSCSRVPAACLLALLFGVVWAVTGAQCSPGGNLFGLVVLFICSVLGGKLVGMIQLPTLPPFPPLLGTAAQCLFQL